MLTVKSFHPDSVLNTDVLSISTTASVGPEFRIVPNNCILDRVQIVSGICSCAGTPSKRLWSIKNMSTSEVYINSGSFGITNQQLGVVNEVGVTSSDTNGRPFISAGTLLQIGWTASRGDQGISILLTRLQPGKVY